MTGPVAVDEARTAAFSDLFRTHARGVQQQVRLWVPASDVDEVLSATFATAWRKFEPGAIEHPRAWLLALAWGHSRNVRRSRRRSEALIRSIADQRPAAASDVPRLGDPDDRLKPVLRALARLSAADQDILTLAAWHELRPEEIAEVLGASPGTARSRLSRARKRLAGAMAQIETDRDRPDGARDPRGDQR